jgi:predicted MPP superfamily phosphohydrolase
MTCLSALTTNPPLLVYTINMKRILPFVLIFSLFLIFLHFVVYTFVSFALPSLTIYSRPLEALIIFFLSISFTLGSVIISKSTNTLGRMFYTLTAYWLGLFIELLFGAIIWSVVTLLFPEYKIESAQALIVLSLLIWILGSINARTIRKKVYEISLFDMPEAWKQKKVVMLSDLHFGAVYGVRRAKKIVRILESMEADVIFLVGDFFDGVKTDEEELARIFSPLKDKIYFVTGNHDGFVTSEKEIHAIESAGLRVLKDEMTEVDGLQILGVSYHDTNKTEKFGKILSEISFDRNKPSILLKHVPLDLDIAEKAGISLTLSGHTHNGQLFPGNLLAKRAHKGFNYGLKELGAMQVLVSSGVGTWGPPLRVGTHSEVLILKFK